MTLDIRGPMNEEALPMILKREKKRYSLPRGVISEIWQNLVAIQGTRAAKQNTWMNPYHGLGVAVPWADKATIPEAI